MIRTVLTCLHRLLLRSWLCGVVTGLPNEQLPVLEIDGYVLPQSMAILRYVGKLGGKGEFCC